MIIEKIWAENFLSFEKVEYSLDQSPIRIQGENKTDNDQESNGSGKSALPNIIEMALIASNSRKSRDVDMIRWGESKATVGVTVFCSKREQRLDIERTIQKSGSKLSLKVNGEGVMFSNIRDGNDFIINWLGISKEDITSYYIINQERFKSFFSSSNKDRIELISRMANTQIIDDIDPLIKSDIAKLEDDKKLMQETKSNLLIEISRLDGRIDSLNERRDDLMNTEEVDNTELVKSCEQRIETIKEKIKGNLESIESKEAQVKGFQNEFIEYSKELDKVKAELDKLNESELNEISDELSKKKLDLKTAISRARANIAGMIECPACHHEFTLSGNVDIAKEKENLEIFELEIEVVDEDVEAVEAELSSVREMRRQVNKVSSKVDETSTSVNRLNNSISSLLNDNDRLASDIEAQKIKIKGYLTPKNVDNTAEIVKIDEQVVEIKGFIATKNDQIVEIDDRIVKIDADIFETEQWVTNFKRFKMHLANSYLETIQGACNVNLMRMNSDLRIMIEGFKVKADGTLKEEITPHIVRDEPKSFFSYSGGERGRVLFATILSIQELINSTNEYGGLQFLSIDEIFEGIDAAGLKSVMKSVRDIGQAVWVTTHVTDEQVSGQTLTVEKVNGISKIKE